MDSVLVQAAARRTEASLRAATTEVQALARRVAECGEPVDVAEVIAGLDRLARLAEQIRATTAHARSE